MKTVKLSYSILDAWKKSKYEEAIAMYLGKPIPGTPYMELGRTKHKQWENYTKKTGKMHPELGDVELKNPLAEKKYEKLIPFNDDYQILLRGIIDLEDGDVITDYKCGRSTPSSYIDGWQLDLYKLFRPHAKMGVFRCFNPYDETLSVGVKFLSEKNAEVALENIITYGGEMIEYLELNKLLQDYNG